MVHQIADERRSSMAANFPSVSSPEHLQELLGADLSRMSVLYFRADWAAPCAQMDSVTLELAKRYPDVLFLSVRLSCLSVGLIRADTVR